MQGLIHHCEDGGFAHPWGGGWGVGQRTVLGHSRIQDHWAAVGEQTSEGRWNRRARWEAAVETQAGGHESVGGG